MASSSSRLTVHHSVSTKYICSLNKRLNKHRESFMQTLDHQRSLVVELKRRVVVLEEEVAFEKARRRRPEDGGHSVPREKPSISQGGMSTDPPSNEDICEDGVTKAL